MPRPGYRARLDDGLKLDINRLARRGFIRRGGVTGPFGITWTHSYWGEIARGEISASMRGDWEGMVSHQGRHARSADYLDAAASAFRRASMVLRMSDHEPPRVGVVDAAGRAELPQSAGMGTAGRLRFAIRMQQRSDLAREGEDQSTANR